MTTSSYGIEGLRTPLAMADAIERVSTLPGVTEVAVTLGHGAPSPLTVQSGPELSTTELLHCLQDVGLRLVKVEGSEGSGEASLQSTFIEATRWLHPDGGGWGPKQEPNES
jgi:hypothetical protein